MNIYAILIAAAVAFGAGWQVQNWRYGEQIENIKYEQSEAARKVFESAQRQHDLDIARKDQALNEATLRAQKNQALARALDYDVMRVRDELAATRTSMPTASCEAVRKHTDTLSAVLGSCIQEYSDVARSAQGHQSDTIMLEQAWPKH